MMEKRNTQKMKKAGAVFLMVAMFLFGMMVPNTVHAATSALENQYAAVYNYTYYRTHNADLQKVYGTNQEGYIQHFIKYGMKEGRQGSEEFNLAIYQYNYADLCKAYGSDNASYYMHYIEYGKAEGRNAKTKESNVSSTIYQGVDYAAVYQYTYYRDHNADLQKVYGTNESKYLEHFVKYGMKEGRQGSEEFNLAIYQYNYADLCKVYGSNNASYYMHYIKYGKAEGRNAKTKENIAPSTIYQGVDYAAVYQYTYYRDHNADLQKAFGTDASKYLEHFVKHGMEEGRQGSEEFNLSVYKKNHSDLVKCFGNDNAAYYRHYINYGKQEGRDAKTLCVITVTFHANGGYFTQTKATTSQVEISKSEAYKFPVAADVTNNSGSVFVGWYANQNCTGNKVKESDIAWGKDITLYAKWSKPYTVTFNANGGYFDGNKQNTTFQFTGAVLSVVPYPENADAHKAFVGWYYDANGTKSAGDLTSYAITSNVTFYAKWETGYSVTLNANGGYFESNGAQTKQCAVRKGAVVSDAMEPVYQDTSKRFDGWYLDQACTKAAGNLGEYVINQDTVFYAKWASNTCKITFNANGGYFEWNGATEFAEYWVKGQKGHETVAPLDYNLHKAFGGWYFDKACTKSAGKLTDFVVTSNTTFYAKWDDAYVATFNANGGYFSASGNTIEQYSVKKGSALSGIMSPVCSGKTFSGWYLDSACTKSAGAISSYILNSDVTFYAKWSAAKIAMAAEGETVVEVLALASAETETEVETEPEIEAETEVEAEVETEAETETEVETEPETEAETEVEAEVETEAETETEVETEPETEAETEVETQVEEEAVTEAE